MTRVINKYIDDSELAKSQVEVTGDMRSARCCVLSVRCPVSSQTRTRWCPAKRLVEDIVSRLPHDYLQRPNDAIIVARSSKRPSREAARKARDNAPQGVLDGNLALAARPPAMWNLPGRGDSAGGSAKQGRDRNPGDSLNARSERGKPAEKLLTQRNPDFDHCAPVSAAGRRRRRHAGATTSTSRSCATASSS
jgi:DNA gyrase/topoisomerase IV subunit B